MTRGAEPTTSHPSYGLGWVMCCMVLTSCSMLQQQTGTPRSADEQLLLYEAIERSLAHARLPLSRDTVLSIETIGLNSDRDWDRSDKDFAGDLIGSWIRSQGFRLLEGSTRYRIRVIIQALGTQQAETFFGMPAITSQLIPFALPELALYKELRQRSIARFKLEVINARSGGLVYTTPSYQGDAYINQYTVLFGFTLRTTDLFPPPPEA